MVSAAKRLTKGFVRACGFELHRVLAIEPEKGPVFPFIEHYSLNYRNCSKPCAFDFWIGNKAAHQWYKEWFYSADNPTWELDEFSWLLEPGDRVLEVGCHHGFLTMMIAHCVGEKGRVCAIDALPENALMCQAQIALNGLGHFCVTKHFAGGESPGEIRIAARTNSHVTSNEDDGICVPVTTADILDAQFGPFNVLKIDVEGFEAQVLKGCSKLLSRKPKLILELHPHFMREYGYGSNLAEVFSLIDAANYEGTTVNRPVFSNVSTFVSEKVSETEVSNVHLRPKRQR